MQHLLNSITEAVVCRKCADELEQGLSDMGSLQRQSSLDVGFTEIGLQVWCRRHHLNVVHIDFAGMSLDADFRCLEPKSSR